MCAKLINPHEKQEVHLKSKQSLADVLIAEQAVFQGNVLFAMSEHRLFAPFLPDPFCCFEIMRQAKQGSLPTFRMRGAGLCLDKPFVIKEDQCQNQTACLYVSEVCL